MDKVVEVLQLVRDELGMSEDAEIRYTDDGRWLCSDAFTFILASKKHQDISFWAEMHKKLLHVSWLLLKKGGPEALKDSKYPWNEILLQCDKEPEVEIILEKNVDGVAVVAYTDTSYAILLEQDRKKGR